MTCRAKLLFAAGFALAQAGVVAHAEIVIVNTSGGPAGTFEWVVNDPQFGPYTVTVAAPNYTQNEGNFYYRNPSQNQQNDAIYTWTISGLDPDAYIAGFSLGTTRITPTVGSGGTWNYDVTLSGLDVETSADVTDLRSLIGSAGVNATPPLSISGDFGNAPVFSLIVVQNDSGSRTVGTRDFTITALPIGIPLSNWNVDEDGAWSAPGSWSAAVPNVAGAVAVFGPIITEPRSVTVDEPVTVGGINFGSANRYTLAGPGGITIDGANGQINVQTGSHTIAAALDLQVNTTVHVAPSAAVLEVVNLVQTDVDITKTGAGTLQVNNIRSNSLAINSGTVRVQTDGGTSVVSGLSISGNARLDLTNNELRVQGGDIQEINALLMSGRADGAWNGPGINSSAAAAESGRVLGIGQDGGDVVVKFTWSGDATLDGAVTIADLGVLAANWQGTDRFWHQGDFNFDGSVTIADLGILAANWQRGVSGASSMSFAEAMAMFDVFNGAVVPEPASLGLLGLGAAALLRRRRQ